MDLATAPSSDSYAGSIGWPRAVEVLDTGGIVPTGRSVSELTDQVAWTIARYESRWSPPHQAAALGDAFAAAMAAGRATLGTPALTNMWAGDRPLSSCAAVPLPVPGLAGHGPQTASEPYYLDNMGSGYCLDSFADPVRALIDLNHHAESVEQSDRCERYVGNMAHLSADHPAVREFIDIKTTTALHHFNLSVDFTEAQLARLQHGDPDMVTLLDAIARAAWACGDPGIISLDRFNSTNPLHATSRYTTTAPCAEVGLAPGDTCLFAYLNLAAFVQDTEGDAYDVDGLRDAARLAVRVLDALVDADEQHLANPLSRALAGAKRRIGLSVCGYADLLVWLGLEYGSPEAVRLLADLLSVVSFEALSTSAELAHERGSFAAFPLSAWATGAPRPRVPTRLVSQDDWHALHARIRDGGIRHSSVTALPPSGRASILLGVNPSIEPFLADPRATALNPALRAHAQLRPARIARTATQIDWHDHLAVVAAAAEQVDESVSKTVNLPSSTTADDIRDVYLAFMGANLKAVSVYRSIT